MVCLRTRTQRKREGQREREFAFNERCDNSYGLLARGFAAMSQDAEKERDGRVTGEGEREGRDKARLGVMEKL